MIKSPGYWWYLTPFTSGVFGRRIIFHCCILESHVRRISAFAVFNPLTKLYCEGSSILMDSLMHNSFQLRAAAFINRTFRRLPSNLSSWRRKFSLRSHDELWTMLDRDLRKRRIVCFEPARSFQIEIIFIVIRVGMDVLFTIAWGAIHTWGFWSSLLIPDTESWTGWKGFACCLSAS